MASGPPQPPHPHALDLTRSRLRRKPDPDSATSSTAGASATSWSTGDGPGEHRGPAGRWPPRWPSSWPLRGCALRYVLNEVLHELRRPLRRSPWRPRARGRCAPHGVNGSVELAATALAADSQPAGRSWLGALPQVVLRGRGGDGRRLAGAALEDRGRRLSWASAPGLERAIDNLIVNAIELAAGPILVVDGRRHRCTLRVSIADSGPDRRPCRRPGRAVAQRAARRRRARAGRGARVAAEHDGRSSCTAAFGLEAVLSSRRSARPEPERGCMSSGRARAVAISWRGDRGDRRRHRRGRGTIRIAAAAPWSSRRRRRRVVRREAGATCAAGGQRRSPPGSCCRGRWRRGDGARVGAPGRRCRRGSYLLAAQLRPAERHRDAAGADGDRRPGRDDGRRRGRPARHRAGLRPAADRRRGGHHLTQRAGPGPHHLAAASVPLIALGPGPEGPGPGGTRRRRSARTPRPGAAADRRREASPGS